MQIRNLHLCMKIRKSPDFLKNLPSRLVLTDGTQFDGADQMKQLPSSPPRHMSDTNETGETSKSPRRVPQETLLLCQGPSGPVGGFFISSKNRPCG